MKQKETVLWGKTTKQTTTRPESYGLFWKKGYYRYKISTIKKRPAQTQNKEKGTLRAPSR